MILIGVDCAAQAKNTGLARGIPADGSRLKVLETRCASSEASAASIVAASTMPILVDMIPRAPMPAVGAASATVVYSFGAALQSTCVVDTPR
jgi:hypothetical protein